VIHRPSRHTAVGRTSLPRVLELQLLRHDHRDALLAFEVENRAYFARSIVDRGDEFYATFAQRHDALLAEQAAGVSAFYVLVDDETGAVVGRFNLYDIAQGSADVGYRVAERVAGRGVATQALRGLCHRAAHEHGLSRLTAGASRVNVASQRVLTKAGFVAEGPSVAGGERGIKFAKALRPSREAPSLHIEVASSASPEVAGLLDALTAELAGAGYSASETFGYSAEQLQARAVHLVGARLHGRLVGLAGLEVQDDATGSSSGSSSCRNVAARGSRTRSSPPSSTTPGITTSTGCAWRRETSNTRRWRSIADTGSPWCRALAHTSIAPPPCAWNARSPEPSAQAARCADPRCAHPDQ
jgi:[ribosomal protein S5]-alanine N-acetyltransferase